MENSDLENFGKRYAEAWCSKSPDKVAEFFSVNGSLSVNSGAPAQGRNAIAGIAKGFMNAFPDMTVTMDELNVTDAGAEFHWTLKGANTGANGTGQKVHIRGVELWQFDKDGLIQESKGSFNEEEYNRQLISGVKDYSESKKLSISKSLLYEYNNALTVLKDYLTAVPDNELKIIINPSDKELESIQSTLTHLIYWGHRYLKRIEKERGNENVIMPKRVKLNSMREYIIQFDNLYLATEEILKNISDEEMIRMDPEYGDYEGLIEHAIVHIYRHKSQIERFRDLINEVQC